MCDWVDDGRAGEAPRDSASGGTPEPLADITQGFEVLHRPVITMAASVPSHVRKMYTTTARQRLQGIPAVGLPPQVRASRARAANAPDRWAAPRQFASAFAHGHARQPGRRRHDGIAAVPDGQRPSYIPRMSRIKFLIGLAESLVECKIDPDEVPQSRFTHA